MVTSNTDFKDFHVFEWHLCIFQNISYNPKHDDCNTYYYTPVYNLHHSYVQKDKKILQKLKPNYKHWCKH